jgi:hypothetical protein
MVPEIAPSEKMSCAYRLGLKFSPPLQSEDPVHIDMSALCDTTVIPASTRILLSKAQAASKYTIMVRNVPRTLSMPVLL